MRWSEGEEEEPVEATPAAREEEEAEEVASAVA